MRAASLRSLILAAVSLLASEATAATLAVPVVEDSWIQNLGGLTNHGADGELRVCPQCYQWTYLKLDLSGVEGEIAAAELRLVRKSGSRPEEISLYRIEDDSWAEATLTGPDRPEPQMPAPELSLARGSAQADHDRWSSGALLQIVRAERDGDRVLSLMLREDYNATFDPRTYHSREGAPSRGQAPSLVLEIATGEPTFRRGDSNGDSSVDVADPIFTLLHLFAEGAIPPCPDAADANDDGSLDLSDAVATLRHLFQAEAPPEPSLGTCGADPTADSLACDPEGECGG